MAKYKCENCGHKFTVNQKNKPSVMTKEKCPACGSTWTRYVGSGLQKDYPICKGEK